MTRAPAWFLPFVATMLGGGVLAAQLVGLRAERQQSELNALRSDVNSRREPLTTFDAPETR